MTTIWQFISSGDLWDFLYKLLIALISPLTDSFIQGFTPLYIEVEGVISRNPALIFSLVIAFILYGIRIPRKRSMGISA